MAEPKEAMFDAAQIDMIKDMIIFMVLFLNTLGLFVIRKFSDKATHNHISIISSIVIGNICISLPFTALIFFWEWGRVAGDVLNAVDELNGADPVFWYVVCNTVIVLLILYEIYKKSVVQLPTQNNQAPQVSAVQQTSGGNGDSAQD